MASMTKHLYRFWCMCGCRRTTIILFPVENYKTAEWVEFMQSQSTYPAYMDICDHAGRISAEMLGKRKIRKYK